jgi:hypothetical protein
MGHRTRIAFDPPSERDMLAKPRSARFIRVEQTQS